MAKFIPCIAASDLASAPGAEAVASAPVPRIVILGGGYVGLYTALTLRRRLKASEAAIAIIDPRSYMTYQPFLPELAAGSLEASAVVVSHRRELKDVEVLTGSVTAISAARHRVTVRPVQGDEYELGFDHLVLALGSVARVLDIPGLAERGLGFKQVEEAIALHNQTLGLLDAAASTWDAPTRRRMLTFTFVGGGFAGVEGLAELEDMTRAAMRVHDELTPDDLRFVLVEASDRILPELPEQLGGYALAQLRARGIEVHLGTRLDSCLDGQVRLSDGTEFESETVVWTAGVRANPVLTNSDLPLGPTGRVQCLATLQVEGPGGPLPGIWAAGDCAAVPDVTAATGERRTPTAPSTPTALPTPTAASGPMTLCAPTAQHAVRQARLLGRNIARAIAGDQPREYRHANAGTVASLGLGKGVARTYHVNVRGPLAWFMHRSYHMAMMPTLSRKMRVVLDWTLALFFRREVVALGALHDPRAEFRQAAAAPPHGRAA